MMQQPAPFDYSGIDPEIAALMRQTAQHVREHVRQTVENAAADGEALIKIKDYLTHGSFMGWVQNVLGLDYKTAQRMMQTAILCRSNMTYVQFGPSVVYELAAPSTPEAVRRAVLAGEVAPTVKAVQEAKRQAAGNGSGRDTGRDMGSDARPRVVAAPSLGARLYDLLDSDAVRVSEEEAIDDIAYWLADTSIAGDGAVMRADALAFAQIIIEGVARATEKPPTNADAGEDEDEDEDDDDDDDDDDDA